MQKFVPDWVKAEDIITLDMTARYIDGYATLNTGTCIRLRGDGTGTDEEGRDWTCVYLEVEEDEFVEVGWALTR